MNYWMDYELRRIARAPTPYPEHAALSWPASDQPQADAWRREVTRFGELLGHLRDHAMASPEELARRIAPAHNYEAQHASSLEAVLWQTLVHNS